MTVDKLYLFLSTLDIGTRLIILPNMILILSCIYVYTTVITLDDICSSVWISDLKKMFFLGIITKCKTQEPIKVEAGWRS